MELLTRKAIEELSASATEILRPQKRRENGAGLLDPPVTFLHDVSYPPGYVPSEAAMAADAGEIDAQPAKEFPFTLGPFLSEAIKCHDNGESVMVSAHTSAGKTVVAFYAIAMSLQKKQ